MVDTSAILNQNLPPVQNPLVTLQQLQAMKLQQAQIANVQQENQNLQTQNATGQQALQVARANRAAQVTYGLSNLSDSQLAGGAPIRAALDNELTNGTIDQTQHDTYIGNLPPATQADGTPTPASAFRPILNSHLVGQMAGPDAIRAVTGTPVTVDNGQQIQGGMQGGPLGPSAGQLNMAPGGANNGSPVGVQKTTSPETNAAINQIWDPKQRAFVPVPRSQLPGASGIPNAPSGIPGGGGYAPVTGTQPSGQPAQTGPQAPLMTSAPIGTAETIGANQKQYQSDIADIPDAQQRIANLQRASQALTALKATGTLGVGADKLQQLKQVFVQMGMATPQTMADVNNYAEANKYFMQNAANLPSVRSDSSLATTLQGYPSTHIPPDAALNITKEIVGRERERIAQVLDAPDKTGLGYQNHSAQFANNNDRRAFAFDMYSPDEQQDIIKSLKGNDLIRFQRSLGVAARQGFITLPNQAQPTQAAPANPLNAPPTGNPLVTGGQ